MTLYDSDAGAYLSASGAYSLELASLIASFEDGEFNDAWHGRKDTVNGNLIASTERAVDGDTAIRHPAGASYDATRSVPGDGLPIYIGVPSIQRFYIWFDDWATANAYWSFCWRNNGNDRLYLRFWGTDDSLYFNETVGGTTDNLAWDTSAGVPSGEWLEVTIRVNDDQGHFSDLNAHQPHVEVWTVDASFNRNTQVSGFKSDTSLGGSPISASNALDAGVGGYRWEFQGSAIIDADYHHVPDSP